MQRYTNRLKVLAVTSLVIQAEIRGILTKIDSFIFLEDAALKATLLLIYNKLDLLDYIILY